MIKFDKWYLPDGEKHLPEWMSKVSNRQDGRLTYQYTKYDHALKYCSNRRVAIDIGAHVGLWSWFMARDFEDVACFEPMEDHRECWHKNMKDRSNAECFESALGNRYGTVKIECRTEGSSGDTGVVSELGDIHLSPLDHFNFKNVDFIKIDTEGYELDVLKGAENTITECKPCIIVEQKGDMIEKYGHEKLAAVKFLESLGAVQREVISGDYILSWD
jgi:FkbM family methyltransferase